MDTRAVAHEVRLRQWADAMRQRAASGQSINVWCEMNGVSRHQYFYWQRKLREAACRELTVQEPTKGLVPGGWARLETSPEAPTVSVEVNGCCVKVSAETDRELLAQVCRMLRAL